MLKVIFIGYFILLLTYALSLKVLKSKEILFRMVISTFVPGFGLLFFILSDLGNLINKKYRKVEEKARDIKEDVFNVQVTSSENLHDEDFMAFSDIMGINDVKTRRKKLFKEINGDIAKISPYLQKFLGDNDAEISHYAASIIIGTKQKINTMCDEMRKEHVKDPENIDNVVEFADSLIVFINSDLFAKDEVIKRRFELSSLMDKMFYMKKDKEIDEKFYVEHIENEIALNKKSKAFSLCREFAQNYPNREKPYQMLLKLFYVMNDSKYFFKVLGHIRDSNKVYSKKFDAIVRFWDEAS